MKSPMWWKGTVAGAGLVTLFLILQTLAMGQTGREPSAPPTQGGMMSSEGMSGGQGGAVTQNPAGPTMGPGMEGMAEMMRMMGGMMGQGMGRMMEGMMGRQGGMGHPGWGRGGTLLPGPEGPVITAMLGLKKELGLTNEQVKGLERLRSDFQKQAVKQQANLRVAELELQELLRQDPIALSQVEAKIREIETARTEARLARIKTIEQGKALLTEEQRKKLEELREASPGPSRHGRMGYWGRGRRTG